MSVATQSFADRAKPLAALGIPVTPLQAESKKAFLPDWPTSATTDPTKIAEWDAAYPNANCAAVATGAPDGVWFFEVDSNAVLDRIKVETGHEFFQDVKTFMVQSRQGRGHVYFRNTPAALAMGNLSQSYVKGGDFSVRVQNQYVVSAGSIHPETRQPYRCLTPDVGPAPAPDWFIEWLKAQRVEKKPTASSDIPRNENDRIPHGYIHGYLVTTCGKLRRLGLGDEPLENALLELAYKNCEPPLDENKIKQVSRSFNRYAPERIDEILFALNAGKWRIEELDEPADTFHVGTIDSPKSNTTLCVFTSEEDAKAVSALGYNTTWIAEGNGPVPALVSITNIKMVYERVIIFGQNRVTESFKTHVTPGSVYGELPCDAFCDIASYSEAIQIMGDDDVRRHLDEQLKSPELVKTSILANPEICRLRARGVLQTALGALETEVDPRIVVRSGAEALKRLVENRSGLPPALSSVSLHGILGDFVDIAYPTTAACRELIFSSMVPVLGAYMGNALPSRFGSDIHPGVTFALNIATSADGKGQAENHTHAAIEAVNQLWTTNNWYNHVASGEGLIRVASLNDALTNGGICSNRLVVVIPEMSACLAAQSREGSTLGDQIRNAYDGKKLENQRSERSKSKSAINYVLGICGSITPEMLRTVLPDVDWKNGSVNRFLWTVVSEFKTRKKRSEGQIDFARWAARVGALYDLNQRVRERTFVLYSDAGAKLWDDWYESRPTYEDENPMADGTRREPAHALRLANLYAQLDERRLDGWKIVLEPVHVQAAIEVVERCRASMQWYLDNGKARVTSTGYDSLDSAKLRGMIVTAISDGGEAALQANEISKAFSHLTAEQRTAMCLAAGLLPKQDDSKKGSGRRATVWAVNDPQKLMNA